MSPRRFLVAILLLGLAIRAGWALVQPSDEASIDRLPDQREYLELGRNLLAGRGLQFYDERFGQTIWAYRTPGYPAFVAACGSNVRVVRIVQALLDTSTALAAALLACRMIVGVWPPVLAAALVAFNPFLVYFSGLVLSETLFIAMLAWGMVLLTNRGWWFGVILLALAVLVRPSALLLGPLLAMANYGRLSAYQRLGRALAALGVTLLVLLPWAARNHARLGHWIWTTTNGGITLYDGFNPNADGSSNQSFLRAEWYIDPKRFDEFNRSEYFKRTAINWAKGHPWQVVELTVLKVLRTWSPVPLSSEFGRPLYRTIGLLFAVPFDLLVIAGLVRLAARGIKLYLDDQPRAEGPCHVSGLKSLAFLLLPAVYFTLVHAASVGSLRYRLPAEPALAVVAAGVLMDRAKDTSHE